MRILLLSPYGDEIGRVVKAGGDRCMVCPAAIAICVLEAQNIDFVISYGYRHRLAPDVVRARPNCNLHISMLPWNRGADPNFWSWFDHTPKGVSIHVMDENFDTGPILCQREVSFREDDTLNSSYQRLHNEIRELFAENWPAIRSGSISPRVQDTSAGSSYHVSKDKDAIFNSLPLKGDTLCRDVAALKPA